MEKMKWKKLATVYGQLEGDAIKSFLEANDIPTNIFQESVGKLIGATLDIFGQVEIFVPAEKFDEAKQLFDEYLDG